MTLLERAESQKSRRKPTAGGRGGKSLAHPGPTPAASRCPVARQPPPQPILSRQNCPSPKSSLTCYQPRNIIHRFKLHPRTTNLELLQCAMHSVPPHREMGFIREKLRIESAWATYLKNHDSIPTAVVVPSQGTFHGSKLGHPGSGSGSCSCTNGHG